MKTRNKMATVKIALMLCIVAALIGCSDGGGGGDGMDYKVGDTGPGGGIIFYVSKTGFTMTDNNQLCHYLEAAPSDQLTTLAWASTSYTTTGIDGTEFEIGTGRKNTALILATDVNAPAAKACKDYTGGSKTDWFLPSKDELKLMYENLAQKGLGGFKTDEGANGTHVYWSSSQYNDIDAWPQSFSGGGQYDVYKTDPYSVRAVRAF